MTALATARGGARRFNARVAVLLMMVVAEVPACGEPSEAERYIQGTWFYRGGLPGQPEYPTRPFTIEWTFASGTFRQTGYPPIFSEGRYRVSRAGETDITLTLFKQKGHFSESDRTILIALDKPAGTITIDKGPALQRKLPP